jgi:phytoene synthase
MSGARDDFDACRTAILHGSRSFYAASKLLPRRRRDPAYALYAFCRLSDDAVDLPGASADAVDRLRARLDGIYAGEPFDAPADRALAKVVRDFDMPRPLLDGLLEGLEWDRDGREYRTLSELRDYAARVAGTVGAMMAVLMGARSKWMLARACDLGVAMQLTNIARDVGEDARNGRIYLPREWLEEFGIEAARFMEEPRHTPEVAEMVSRLLAEADRLYTRSEAGIAGLATGCRPAIWAARYIYAAIGAEIEKLDFNSVDHRAHTSTGRKVALLGRAVTSAAMPRRANRAESLVETRFLVDAAAQQGARDTAWWELDERIAGMFDTLNEVHKRERDAMTIQIGE